MRISLATRQNKTCSHFFSEMSRAGTAHGPEHEITIPPLLPELLIERKIDRCHLNRIVRPPNPKSVDETCKWTREGMRFNYR